MRVSEMIEQLQKFPPNALVVFPTFDHKSVGVIRLVEGRIRQDGKLEEIITNECSQPAQPAVIIR